MDDWVLVDSSQLEDDAAEVVVVGAAMAASDSDGGGGGEECCSDDDDDDDGGGYDFYGCDDGTVVELEPSREEFTEELRLRVLTRLPVSDLMRFRSVSASWKGWISSPFFAREHSIHPRALSGLFFHGSDGSPSFASFVPVDGAGGAGGGGTALPDPSLSFLPEPVAVVASTRGLICARGGTTGGYYVANPATTLWESLPQPSVDHTSCDGDAAVVIVFEHQDAFNFSGDFHVVVAFPVCPGVYSFESFSSKAWAWRVADEVCGAECIVATSGVAAAGQAFWRTTMNTIVCYDPVGDKWDMVWLPLAVTGGDRAWWEIGESEGRLCATRVAEEVDTVEVLFLEPGIAAGEMVWKRGAWFGGGNLRGREEVTVLRSQGAAEVVLWDPVGDCVVAMDMSGCTTRFIDAVSRPGYFADFVPYVSTIIQIPSRHGNDAWTSSSSTDEESTKIEGWTSEQE